MHWRYGSGLQSPNPIYKSKKLGIVNAGLVTTFNELAVVSENRLTTIRSNFNPEYAALMGCAITTGFGVINNNAKVKIGQSVVIWGAGGIGLNMVQAANMVSAFPIIALDLIKGKLELAKKLGATHTIDINENDPIKSVMDIVGDRGADIVVDNTGNNKVIRDCYNITNSSGRTILVGVPSEGNESSFHTLPLHFGKVLTGSHGGDTKPHIDIPRYIKLCISGRMQLQEIVTDRFDLNEINFAVKAMKEGSSLGRVMIHFN